MARLASSESIITLPTNTIRSAAMPSRNRLSCAVRSVVYSTSATWSVSTRLISSGMPRSKLRSPASTCATGTPFFTATSVQASVELTSPTTTTQDGLEVVDDRLETAHHLGGLHRVRTGAHLEVEVGPRQAQVSEELVAHVGVVVLAGVDEDVRQAVGV